jgi:nucleotide-binding universal stress UspA family protein
VEVSVYKVIVVGTDGSDRAAVAVSEALALATITGATVHGVHVLRPVLMTGTEQLDATAVTVANADRHDESERIHKQVLAEAERLGVSAQMDTFDGDPADALVRVAEAVHADLVVVGNRGMAGVRRFVLGSVPNKVAHHCPCSLLIVDTDRARAVGAHPA